MFDRVWYSLPLMASSAFPSQCCSSAAIAGRQQCTPPRHCDLLKPFKCQAIRKLANTGRTPASFPLSRTDNAPRNGVPFVPSCATPPQPRKVVFVRRRKTLSSPRSSNLPHHLNRVRFCSSLPLVSTNDAPMTACNLKWNCIPLVPYSTAPRKFRSTVRVMTGQTFTSLICGYTPKHFKASNAIFVCKFQWNFRNDFPILQLSCCKVWRSMFANTARSTLLRAMLAIMAILTCVTRVTSCTCGTGAWQE